MTSYAVVSSVRLRRAVDQTVGLRLSSFNRPFRPYSWTSKVRQWLTLAVVNRPSDENN